MQFIRTVGLLLGGILAIVALYFIGHGMLWLLYAIGVVVYWAFASALALAIVCFALGFIVMLGHWLWPGEIQVSYIPYEEGEEPA